MINPRQKSHSFRRRGLRKSRQKTLELPPSEQYALTQDWPKAHEVAVPFMVRSPDINQFATEFFENELGLLRELYDKYKIPPAEIVEAVALCKFAPMSDRYPDRLRNARRRKRVAERIEKTAALVNDLAFVNGAVWNVNVLSQNDIDLELKLKELAKRVRQLPSIGGRPEKRMRLRECAVWLEKIFRKHTRKTKSLYRRIAELLSVAFPDQWQLHGTDVEQAEISAVKDLLRRRRQRRYDQKIK